MRENKNSNPPSKLAYLIASLHLIDFWVRVFRAGGRGMGFSFSFWISLAVVLIKASLNQNLWFPSNC